MDFLSEDLQAAVDMQSPSTSPILHVWLDENVQHWTSSGSSGQKPGVDLLPEDLQDSVEMHSPGAFPTLQAFVDGAGGSESDEAGGPESDGTDEPESVQHCRIIRLT